MASWDKKRMIEDYGMSEAEVYSTFTGFIDQFSNKYERTSLADRVLLDDHPALQQMLEQAIHNKRNAQEGNAGSANAIAMTSDSRTFKWPGNHFDESIASGKKWWAVKPVAEEVLN